MDGPIALPPGGDPVKADRPELSLLEITFDPGGHTPGGFVQYRGVVVPAAHAGEWEALSYEAVNQDHSVKPAG